MKTKTAKGPLPYFDKIQEVVLLPTPDRYDHGWMVMIARNPYAGRRSRYSVLKLNCQTHRMSNHACEVDLMLARKIQRSLVKELVVVGAGPPYKITGWDTMEPFQYL